MKRLIVILFLISPLLSGCANKEVSLRYDVALSYDSERIAYGIAGRGKTSLIFIHSWSCDGRYWQKQTSEFAKYYQVITVDLAGHGHSSFNRSELSMVSFAKDVKAIIDHENIDRAILVGHSMGGAVIAEAARLLPQRVIELQSNET